MSKPHGLEGTVQGALLDGLEEMTMQAQEIIGSFQDSCIQVYHYSEVGQATNNVGLLG